MCFNFVKAVCCIVYLNSEGMYAKQSACNKREIDLDQGSLLYTSIKHVSDKNN